MDSKEIGTFIAALRKEKGYTQAVLAEKLNISNRTVSKWENGDGLPDVSILPILADILGVTVDEILSAEKKDTPNIKVTEVASKDKVNNIFQMAYIVSLFFGIFGAVLGTVTEIYNIWAFNILFYNHWEILFVAISLFAIVLSAMVYAVGVTRMNIAYSKREILNIAGYKGLTLGITLSLMPLSFIVRIVDVTFRSVALVKISAVALTFLLFLIVLLVRRKLDEKIY